MGFTLFLMSVLPLPAQALKPEEILVVANQNARHSLRLAKYYMQKRGIPDENLVKLWVTDKEAITRENYERKIVKRIRKKLLSYQSAQRPRCLALIYGVPLKVAPVPLTQAEKAELGALNEENKDLKERLEFETLDSGKKEIKVLMADLRKEIQNFKKNTTRALRWIQSSHWCWPATIRYPSGWSIRFLSGLKTGKPQFPKMMS